MFLEDARLANRRVAYTAEEALVVRGEAGPVLIMLKGMIQTLHGRDETQRLDVTRFEELSYDIGAMVSKSSARGRDLRDYATLRLLNPDAELLAATGSTTEITTGRVSAVNSSTTSAVWPSLINCSNRLTARLIQ